MPPRPLRPREDTLMPDGADSTSSDTKTNKRRAVSSACIPCRKRKSKCDGAVPSCSTCTAVYRTECSYDADSDHRRKGALKRDILCLQQQNDALEVIVASLRGLPEDEAVALLHNLRTDASLDNVAAGLRTNVQLPTSYAPQTLEADFAQQMSQQTPVSIADSAGPNIPRSREASTDESQDTRIQPNASEPQGMWFRQPQDAEFMEHLLNLYFCWVHPFHHFFSRELFVRDMEQGRTEHCSAMLVNAVMSLACHYSDRPGARTDLHNPATAGDHFFAEAQRLLNQDEKPCLTTVQALGVLAVCEGSHGREGSAYRYAGRSLRMALELGYHLSVIGSGLRSTDVEARRITFWAIFNLETTCSVSFGRLSLLPRAAADIPKPAISDRLEPQTWRPYEDANLALSPSAEQPARPMVFIDCVSRLSELACDMVNTFYAPQERFTSRRLAAAYEQYQDWYRKLPNAFRLENTSLPHVIVLHMYYYACVLHLFRPYIKLDLRGAGLYPRDTCTYCANEISNLMSALRAMYGLRRVCLLACSWIMSASTIHLLNLPSDTAAANLSQGMNDLQSMSVNHQFASRCIDIIRSLANKWNIALPEDVALRAPSKQFSSPPASSFFAASIPRQSSSQSANSGNNGSRGSVSNGPSAEQPFQPTQQSPSHPSFPRYYSDPATPLDLAQAESQFWTPFPGQGVPMQPLGYSDVMVDFNNKDFGPTSAGHEMNGVQHNMQWQMFGTNSGPSGLPTSHPATTVADMDSALSSMAQSQQGTYQDINSWQWQ